MTRWFACGVATTMFSFLLVSGCASDPEPTVGTTEESVRLPDRCVDGESRMADDGCNTCSCLGGQWACTKKACRTNCPKPTSLPPGRACAQVIVAAKDPASGACCQYPTPCSAPKGWKTFYSMEECEAAPLEDECLPSVARPGMCLQVIAYARSSHGTRCCSYPTPCNVPAERKAYYSQEECEASGAEARPTR